MISKNIVGKLKPMYFEKGRFYHNWQHIEECMDHLKDVKGLVKNYDALEMAILFHDAIYDTHATNNEEKSAKLAQEILNGKYSEKFVEEVSNLILATKHNGNLHTQDEEFMVDIDLAILGSNRERYEEYASQIKKEYSWVPEDVYNRERPRVLGQLSEGGIYITDFFRNKYEESAKRNISWEINKLCSK